MEESDAGTKVPQTFVMERGKVGKTLAQLVLDFRKVMEPYTASKLKVSILGKRSPNLFLGRRK